MPRLSLWQVVAIVALISLPAGFGGGWLVNGWRLHSKIASLQTQQAQLQATIDKAYADGEEKARTLEHDRAIAIADLSQSLHDAEAKNAQLENDRDAAIAAGTQRVYVRANCPTGNSMPADAVTASGDHAAAAELDPAYRQALSDLRRGAEQSAEQIIALERYAGQCPLLNRQAN